MSTPKMTWAQAQEWVKGNDWVVRRSALKEHKLVVDRIDDDQGQGVVHRHETNGFESKAETVEWALHCGFAKSNRVLSSDSSATAPAMGPRM